MPESNIMKKHLLSALAIGALTSAHAEIIQTISGPDDASGGGDGNTLIDTTNDTDDWIDTLNAGGTVFIGFDWVITNNAGETGTGGFFGGLGVYNGSDERLLIGNGWASLTFSAGAGGTIEDTGVAYVVGETVRIVTELTVVAEGASNDTWRTWINPDASDLATPGAQRTDWTIGDFTQITHRAGNDPGASTMTNIIVADDFVSAIVAAPAAGPIRITTIEIDAETGDVTVTWTSTIGRFYFIETSTTLAAEGWGNFDDAYPAGGATGALTSITFSAGIDPIPPETREFFVRVHETAIEEPQ